MQRRLALAAAFVHDPALVFLDEPTAGIDPILRAKFWDQFRELRDAGRTLVVTTQYVGEAAKCDLVGVLSDGELLMLDTPANLLRAAFDGEVLDVELAERRCSDARRRSVTSAGSSRDPRPSARRRGRSSSTIRSTTTVDRCATRWSASAPATIEARDHPVDFDEAFVRIIERHRAETAERDERDEQDERVELPA